MNLEELERLAKEADNGPWLYDEDENMVFDINSVVLVFDARERNTKYIAAANPKVILEMIEEIKKKDKEIDRLREVLGNYMRAMYSS